MARVTPDSPPTYFTGTSGWTYDHWRGDFYPQDLPRKRWFDYYAALFNSVEVNATFYRPFADQTYLSWKGRAPQGFGYILKVPRDITHKKLLKDAEEDIHNFSRAANLLGDTFEAFLLQLAPSMPHDPGLLRSALQAFGDPARVAVEFRSERWAGEDSLNLLRDVRAVYCNVDSPGHPLPSILTSERAYLRLHGRQRWYSSNYSDEELSEMAGNVRSLVERGARRVYTFFNNDIGGYAPRNAQTLHRMLLEGLP